MSPRRDRALDAFIERGPEIAELSEALDEAASGSPSVVIVSADAGVGKTRLLHEFVTRVGGPVLWGGCLPIGDRGLPLAPVVEALRGLRDDPRLAELISPDLLLMLSSRDGGSPAHTVGAAQTFPAILDLIEELSAAAPAVVVVEDLHWADQWTLDLLTFLVPNLRSQKLLLIGSYRSDDLTRDDPLRQVLVELARYRHYRRLELAPFTIDQVGQQIEALTGQRPSAQVVDLVFARTQGNAYFVEELVAAGGLAGRELPASLRDLLLVRTGVVSAPARRLLGMASLAVTEVSDALLAQVSGAPIDELSRHLHELINAHLLVATPSGLRFRHALMQEALQAELLPGERQDYHSAYAAALRSRSGVSRDSDAAATAQLAYHLHGAGNTAEAMGAWVEAAGEAEAVAAFADAHHHLVSALSAWDLVENPEARAGGSRVDLLTRAAEDALHAGDPTSATTLVRQAIDLVDESAELRLAGMLHERLSRYLRATSERDEMFEAIERALQLVPSDPPSEERARVLAGYAGCLGILGRNHEARTVAGQAVEMARSVGATLVECTALSTLGVLTCYVEDYSKGMEQIEAALTMATAIGDPHQQRRGYVNLYACASEAGRWEESVANARLAIEETPRLGPGHRLQDMYRYLQRDLVKLGRFEEARAVANEAAERFPLQRDESSSIWLLIALGEFDAARRAISRRDAVEDDERRIELTALLSDVETWTGNTQPARDTLDTSLELSSKSERPIARAYSLAFGLRCEANAADRVRTRRDSRELKLAIERGQRLGELMVELAGWPGPEDGWKREVSVLASVCAAERTRVIGKSDPQLWSDAVTNADGLSMVYLSAYAELRLAEAIVASGDDRDEAARRLRHVHRLTCEWGTRPLRELVERLAARARIDIGVAAAADIGHGLTSRERQVLELVTRGAGNRQISEELFISQKTTSVHVSNILRKLGVASRGEAASMAYEKGWVDF